MSISVCDLKKSKVIKPDIKAVRITFSLVTEQALSLRFQISAATATAAGNEQTNE